MASICTSTIELHNGMVIPAIGLGGCEAGNSYSPDKYSKVLESIIAAIKAGYRLIDTAKCYGTEEVVGEAIRKCGIPRSEITVITKLWQSDHWNVAAAFEESFKKLNVEYVDIYLMHWPNASSPDDKTLLRIDQGPSYLETWKDMEKLVGPKCRSIGVSNFTQKTLQVLLNEGSIKPVVNEIECHPLNPNLKLVPWCQERGIEVIAWAPIAGGPKSVYGPRGANLYNDGPLAAIAESHQVTMGQVILSYLVKRRIIPVPHSSSPVRQVQNITLMELDDEEMKTMDEVQDRLGFTRLFEHIDHFCQEDGVVRNADGSSKGRTILAWTKEEFGWEDSEGRCLT